MTDYNDGKWHGWNGGECPVDSESKVLIQTVAGVDGSANDDPVFAGDCEWDWCGGGTDIIAFRVTKPDPPKPREWYAVGRHLHDTEADAVAFRQACADMHGPHHLETPIIHVREVLS